MARLNIKTSGELQPGEVEISAHREETGSNETIVEATVDGIGSADRLQRQVPARSAGSDQDHPMWRLRPPPPTRPVCIRPVGDDNFLHVIMPMHLG